MKMDLFQGTYGVKLIRGILSPSTLLFGLSQFWELVIFASRSFYKNNSFSYRFSYIAICCLSILHRFNKINVEKAVSYIVSCKNLDGGFGCSPGGESHAGQSMLYINLQSLYEVFTFWLILINQLCFPLIISFVSLLVRTTNMPVNLIDHY